MLKPNTLAAAFILAHLQEEEVSRKQYPYRNNQTPNILYNSTFKTPLKTPTQNTIHILPPPHPILRLLAPQRHEPTFNKRNPYPVRRISPNQMQERREKTLCNFCDKKYQAGHICNKPRLYLLKGIERRISYQSNRDNT